MNFYYSAYGLLFESAIELPELVPQEQSKNTSHKPDVSISFGEVPENLQDPLSSGVMFEANEHQFILKIGEVARYSITNGSSIVIQADDKADANDVRVFMLGSAFGVLLHQRQLLVLHAGAIRTPQGAVLFAGPSGVGKSTLLGELLNRGYEMLVDDVCAVTVNDENEVVVIPGYPRTRLWADSARALNVDTSNLQRTRPQLEKYERQVPSQFCSEPTPLKGIYILSQGNTDIVNLTPLPVLEKFGAVMQNTYRHVFLDGLKLRNEHFAMATKVSSGIQITEVERPSIGFRLTELANAVEEDFLTA